MAVTGREGLEKIKRFLDIFAFYTGLLLELAVSPLGYLYGFGKPMETVLIFCGMLFFSISLACKLEWNKELLAYAVLFGFALLCLYAQKSALILRLVLILLAGQDKDKIRVMKTFFWGTLFLVLMAAAASLKPGGWPGHSLYLEELFRSAEERRYTFGFFHPNGFSFFWARLVILWGYLYGSREQKVGNRWLKLGMDVASGVLALLPLLLSKSRTALGVCVLYLSGLYIWKWSHGKIRELLYRTGLLMMALELFLFYTLGIFPYPEHVMGDSDTPWDWMNMVTSGRLDHARKALLNQPLTILGQRDVADATEIGFVNSLFHQGLLFCFLYILLLFALYRWLYRKKDGNGMLLVLAMTAYAAGGAFLPYFNKNLLWMLLLGFALPDKEVAS